MIVSLNLQPATSKVLHARLSMNSEDPALQKARKWTLIMRLRE